MPEAYKERIRQARPQFNQIAKEQFGLVINPGPTGISSRTALMGAKYAAEQGVGEAYNVAVLTSYWQEARDISDPEVLAIIATEIGLEAEAFTAALNEPQWTAAVEADVRQAHDYMISGVPALIFERKYFVSGAQPYPVLAQAIERIEQELGDQGSL